MPLAQIDVLEGRSSDGRGRASYLDLPAEAWR
jgi:hypothetical protein